MSGTTNGSTASTGHAPTRTDLSTSRPLCPAAATAVSLLSQCAEFVASLDDVAYRTPSRAMMAGTIGKHLRHSLDHFAAVAAAAADPAAPIDYDRRLRDVPMETDRAVALRTIDDIARRLATIDAAAAATPVSIRVMLAADGTEAVLPSFLAREIAFAAHHAVHHHAMMKVIADELGVPCPEGFGKAPSTLNHERAVGAQGGKA